MSNESTLNFDVTTGLKRVLGRELITDDQVAIFEMVKNSFDANATIVHIYIDDERIVVADNGDGMSLDDLHNKWLLVAYSSKREGADRDYRDVAADRHFAGSKGIGRFSSDRLGETLDLRTRPRAKTKGAIHHLTVDWSRFEQNSKQRFETIGLDYDETDTFALPPQLKKFADTLTHGTVVSITDLRDQWNRRSIATLKSSLAKLINPFGEEADAFAIYITAPNEADEDKRQKRAAAKEDGGDPSANNLINGRVGNPIFAALQSKTTFITVEIDGDSITTTLTDRGETVYKIKEPNQYQHLADSGFKCTIYYLNQSARLTFARRVGIPSVNFGSIFLFRNRFRVYPIGEEGNDWFAFDRRKQQGYARFLGTREVIGRVDVFGTDRDFQEASSRNQGLIDTPAVRELRRAVMEHGLKRLEKYVVPVSWPDKADSETDDLSRLLTDPGRTRISTALAALTDNKDIELIDYSKKLIGLVSERSEGFETSLAAMRSIATKAGDRTLLSKLDKAEKRFDELRKSEAQARAIADRERAAADAAAKRAEKAEASAAIEIRRSHFLETVVNVDAATILNLHHQVTIYAVDIGFQIENLLAETAGQSNIPRERVLEALERMAFLNKKVLSITKFATKAKFKLDSENINSDLVSFISEYIDNVIRSSGNARLKVSAQGDHPGLKMRFNPIDISIVIDNLISNARRAKASSIQFEYGALGRSGLFLRATDNGRGFTKGVDPTRIFEMGYSTTHGSGLGLYHVRQVLGEMNGSIELEESKPGHTSFIIKISPGTKTK